jgi:short chain dehydrogenase
MRRAEQTSRQSKKRHDATKPMSRIIVSEPKQPWWNLWARWQTSRAAAAQSGPPLGYALVTGASAGIGRAIAVELARWKIPLILVARDATALTDLAVDLEACYGVDCCVLPADLSQPTAADKIYETVSQAGLLVDVRRMSRELRVLLPCVCVAMWLTVLSVVARGRVSW